MAGNNTNYKPLFMDKLQEFIDNFPEYSLGEMFHSILTQLRKSGIEVNSKGDILNLSDNVLYSAIDRAIRAETEQ